MIGLEKMIYPKGETVWVGYYSKEHELLFIMTSKESSRDFYYLYQVVDGKFVKLGKAKSSKELEEKFEVDKKMGCGH